MVVIAAPADPMLVGTRAPRATYWSSSAALWPLRLASRACPSRSRAAPRHPRQYRQRRELRGLRGRVHPDRRCRGTSVLRLPRLPSPRARQRNRASSRLDDDSLDDGARLPEARTILEVLDRDRNPLVEVVQDTVGRHDTFGLACTTRTYEDAGYSDISTARITSTKRSEPIRSANSEAGRRSISLQHQRRCLKQHLVR